MQRHERDRRVEPEPLRPRVSEPARPANDVLGLQRSAGNQAVSALLARDQAPAKDDARGHATLSGIGKIPILSFSRSIGSGRGPASFDFTSHVGTHSSKLQQALTSGHAMDGEAEVPGFKVKLPKSIVATYETSAATGGEPPMEGWTLVPESVRIDDGSGGGSGGGGGGGGSTWDTDDRRGA